MNVLMYLSNSFILKFKGIQINLIETNSSNFLFEFLFKIYKNEQKVIEKKIKPWSFPYHIYGQRHSKNGTKHY